MSKKLSVNNFGTETLLCMNPLLLEAIVQGSLIDNHTWLLLLVWLMYLKLF